VRAGEEIIVGDRKLPFAKIVPLSHDDEADDSTLPRSANFIPRSTIIIPIPTDSIRGKLSLDRRTTHTPKRRWQRAFRSPHEP
jgi:antitoxin (DNA-binding transcriptional repressor) of toxin-antitoxin stability system